MKNDLASIRSRRSVRTFDGKPLCPEDAEKVMGFAKTADNPYAIPVSWKLLDAKKDGLKCPVIAGTDTYIAGKMRVLPHSEEAFGYSFERIVLYAESLGLGTTWIAGTMDRDAFEKAMELEEGEIMPCVSPLGYPASKMSLREKLMRKGVRADSRMEFGKLFFNGNFSNPLTEDKAGVLKEAFEAVRLGPSAVNKQPWRAVLCEDKVHFYEFPTPGYVSGSGWDLQKIDLGIALCHFVLAAKECGIETVFEQADPGIGTGDRLQYIASYTFSS